LGPFEQGGDFSDRGMAGIRRFLQRIWQWVGNHRHHLQTEELDLESQHRLHQTIHKVSEDILALKYNTAIAALMTYFNTLQPQSTVSAVEVKSLLLMLAPFAPHLSEELWQQLGETESIHRQRFPIAHPAFLVQDQVAIAVQINGRTRGTVMLSPEASEEEAMTLARQTAAIQRYLQNQVIRRVVYVPGRILNLVI
jgi:leucyl-tRNA synthetase